MLISNKIHYFRNFKGQRYAFFNLNNAGTGLFIHEIKLISHPPNFHYDKKSYICAFKSLAK